MTVELRKSKYRHRQIIVHDGEEVGAVEYTNLGGGRWVFYHPAPKNSVVTVANIAGTDTRATVSVVARDDIIPVATKLIADGVLKPVAHWQAEKAAAAAKRKTADEVERAARQALLAVLRELVTEDVAARAQRAAASGEGRIPCFISVEWVTKALAAIDLAEKKQ